MLCRRAALKNGRSALSLMALVSQILKASCCRYRRALLRQSFRSLARYQNFVACRPECTAVAAQLRMRMRIRTEHSLANFSSHQPAPKYHTKGCSHSSADSPGARTLVFAAFEPFHSCEFRASLARTPFSAILWRSPKPHLKQKAAN